MADAPKEPETEESEETLLPSLLCLYCSEAQVYVRLFRWNAGDHLACHCRNCGHRWQMREQPREQPPEGSLEYPLPACRNQFR